MNRFMLIFNGATVFHWLPSNVELHLIAINLVLLAMWIQHIAKGKRNGN